MRRDSVGKYTGDKPRGDAATLSLSLSLSLSLRCNAVDVLSRRRHRRGPRSDTAGPTDKRRTRGAEKTRIISHTCYARGTGVGDRITVGRVCAALLRRSSPIGCLLHCGAASSPLWLPMLAHAVSVCAVPQSLSLFLSLGWRRLLLSAS